MAYQALYRKYRPSTFSDVIGQEHITEILKNELSGGKTVHAYLFTGTRGTGKTSCAKILAKAVNCLDSKDGNPCLECASCKSINEGENTDIVEIDAASNNSVDSIRELRDLISFAPSNSKYRVYIIDEVHMLSISAFNALLKTLEEPPAHVIFILATTEVHKLPATILSRCQRFDFMRIEPSKICERIQYIAKNEGITVTEDAAALIASAADGGMRDALSILDLCASSSKNIDESVVESVCAMAGNEYLLELSDCIKNQDTEKSLLLIDKLHNASVDMMRLLNELTSHYRDLMIAKTVKSATKPIVCSISRMKALEKQAQDYEIKDIMYCLSVLQSAFATMQTGNRRCEMEMAVIKLCNPELSLDNASLDKRITALEKGSVGQNRQSPLKTQSETVSKTEKTSPLDAADDIVPENDAQPAEDNVLPEGITAVEQWNDILKLLRVSNPLINGVLKDSKAYIKGQYLLIDAKNSQFRSLINSENGTHKESIRKAALEVLGQTYKLGPYTPQNNQEQKDPLLEIQNKLKKFEIN